MEHENLENVRSADTDTLFQQATLLLYRIIELTPENDRQAIAGMILENAERCYQAKELEQLEAISGQNNIA